MTTSKGWLTLCLFLVTCCLPGCNTDDLLSNPQPREREIVEEVEDYEAYSFIPTAKKTTILHEDFDNNSRGWRTASTTGYSMSVMDGELLMNATNTNAYQQNTINLSELTGTEDFEIEARVWLEHSWNNLGDGNAILWGLNATSPSRWLYYEINDNKQMTIGQYNGQQYLYDHSSTTYGSASEYYRGEYNLLTVRKVKNTSYYFMNGDLLTKKEFVPFYGSRIGFQVGAYSKLHIDYLQVRRLVLD